MIKRKLIGLKRNNNTWLQNGVKTGLDMVNRKSYSCEKKDLHLNTVTIA